MRMTSRTSVMSTSGVTLMLEMMSSSLCAEAAMTVSLSGGVAFGLEVRHHLAAETFGAREPRLDDALEGVEERDRGQRHQDADRGRDQRLADLGHQPRGDLAGRVVQLVEGADDADDRAEQPDERRVRAQGAQE